MFARNNILGNHWFLEPDPDEIYYAHQDHLGSVAALVDGSGAIAEGYRYVEWGQTTIVDSSFTKLTTTEGDTKNNVRYTGRDQYTAIGDTADTWYNNRARALRTKWGRFIQRDPHGYTDGSNLVVYVMSSPLISTDPLGTTCTLNFSNPTPPEGGTNCNIYDQDKPGGKDAGEGTDSECGKGYASAELDTGLPGDDGTPSSDPNADPCVIAPTKGQAVPAGGAAAIGPGPSPPPVTFNHISGPPETGSIDGMPFVMAAELNADAEQRVGIQAGMKGGDSIYVVFCWAAYVKGDDGYELKTVCTSVEVTCDCE